MSNILTIDVQLTEDIVLKIRKLKSDLKMKSEADVISYAITLLEKVKQEKEMGRKVLIEPNSFLPSGSTTKIKMKY